MSDFERDFERLSRQRGVFGRHIRNVARLDRKAEEAQWRAALCADGTHAWYSVCAPMEPDYKKQRFHRLPGAARPPCGARCRDGHACRARVAKRADGRHANRCRMHGGLSTGPTSAAGRARIAESNRRRAKRDRAASE